jgi:hypothetical protein
MSEQPREKVQKLLAALYGAIARKKVTPEEIAEIKARLETKAAWPRRRRRF